MIRRLAHLAAVFGLVSIICATPAAAAEGLTVESVDLGDLPHVSIVVALPASMLGTRPGAEDFAVLIDGSRPRVDVFAAVEDPLEVVLLLDTSGSMAGEPMQQAATAASRFVEVMPGTATVTVIAFGESVRTVAGPGDDATAAIAELTASGETALYDAVVAGAAAFDLSDTRRVMILMSDGGDTVSTATLDEAADAAATSGAEITAVALATSESDDVALVRITGGSVSSAGAADELADRYAELAATLTGRYRLAFTHHASGPTEITVLVNGPTGVATSTVVVEFPIPGSPSSPGGAAAKPTAGPLDAPESVTIAAPGPLGSPWVLPTGVALVFIGSVVTLWLTLRQRDDRPPAIEIPRPDQPASAGPLASLAAKVRSLGDRYAERDEASSIDASLDQAGINLRPGEFVVVSATGIVVVTLLGMTVAGAPGAIIFGGAAAMAPRTILKALTERRRRAFGDQLEGTLQIIAGSLRAGYGLTQSISTVAEESPAPTSQEFNRVVIENRLGRTVEQSMEAMAARMDNEDLGWVVDAIQIQHEVGGNLAEVLDTVTATIRDRNQIKRQVKALSAEGRISAFILLALPFVIGAFIAMISPDYLSELTTTTLGRIMLGIAALLMGAGAAWIKKIVKVDF